MISEEVLALEPDIIAWRRHMHQNPELSFQGALGRTMSPLAGVTILVSGIAMVNPIDVIKRTAIPCIIAVFACAFLMV